MQRPKIEMGKPLATPGALEALDEAGQTTGELLSRHLAGDWGDLGPEDAALNNDAVTSGDRILSSYRLNTGVTVWVISEATDDHGRREATTLILPEEY